MSNAHTPGPWEVSKIGLTNDGAKPVVSADRRIATVDAAVDLPKRDMWQAECAGRDANARLIAAAPDMLEALIAGEKLISGDLVGSEWKRACREFLNDARAAIAKAEGRNND